MDALTIVTGILQCAGICFLLRVAFSGETREKPKPKNLRYCPTCKKYRNAD